MKKIILTMLVATMPLVTNGVALADGSKTGIYEISEIYIIPSELKSENVQALFHHMVDATKGEPGLLQITVTRQIGAPYNYTVIERWKDQASLDAHTASAATKQFAQALEPLISGPTYQRVFSVFE